MIYWPLQQKAIVMEELNHQGWIDQIPVTILLKRNKAKQVEIITRRRKAKKTVNVREANHPSKCLDVMYLPLQRNDHQKNDHTAVLNARSVISAGADKTVLCVETYANKTKRVRRNYPFSVKYISCPKEIHVLL